MWRPFSSSTMRGPSARYLAGRRSENTRGCSMRWSSTEMICMWSRRGIVPSFAFVQQDLSYNLLCYLETARSRREEARVADEQARDEDLVRDEDDHDLLTFSESAIRLR